jgi:hypothetical protein
MASGIVAKTIYPGPSLSFSAPFSEVEDTCMQRKERKNLPTNEFPQPIDIYVTYPHGSKRKTFNNVLTMVC